MTNLGLISGNQLLGYAQFPEDLSSDPNTDGVVIHWRAFGRGAGFNLMANFDLGRTATHEIGHWMGLIHIWGDDSGGCSGSDMVADTPNQGNNSFNVPTFPTVDNCTTTNPGIMFMNYMDYTDDVGMNLFTNGQKGRMRANFDPSGFREDADYAVGVSITGSSLVCITETYVLTNQPAGTTETWISSNPTGLSINATTGVATRQNNFNGQVTITATINSGCGSVNVTRNVNVGNYHPTGVSSYNSNCSGGNFNYLNTSLSSACTANTPIYFSYRITDSNYSNFVFTPVSVPSGASWSFSGGNLYMTVYTPPSQGSRSATIALSATGPCGPYSVNFTSTAVNYYSGGYYYSSFPNPASETLTIEQTYNTEENREVGTFLKGGSLDTHYFGLYDFNNSRVVLEGSVSRKTEIDVSKLDKGRYILKIQIANDKEETHHVIIN